MKAVALKQIQPAINSCYLHNSITGEKKDDETMVVVVVENKKKNLLKVSIRVWERE